MDTASLGITTDGGPARWCSPERIIAAISEPMLAVDTAGVIAWCNSAAASFFGRDTASLIGRDEHETLCAAGAGGKPCDRDACGLRIIARGGKSRRASGEFFHLKSGKRIACDIEASAISQEGKVAGSLQTFRRAEKSSSDNAGDHLAIAARHRVFDNGVDGIFRTNAAGHYLAVNQAFAETHGFPTPADFIATVPDMAHAQYVQPEQFDEFTSRMREAGNVSQFELQIIRRDGTAIWISVTAKTLFDETGAPQFYEGSVQDVTWRKLAEEVLKQAEEKWRALVESSGECIMIANKAGDLSFANGNAQIAALGVAGESILSRLTPPSQQLLRKALDRVFRTKRAEILELERKTPRSAAVWFETRVVPIEQAGAIDRVILIGTNITARRRAEDAVHESRRFIERVADTSPAILYVYDLIGARYVYVNHQVEKILGYSGDQFVADGSRMAHEIIHPDDRVLLTERERQLAAAGRDGVVFECLLRMKDVRGQWLSIRTRDVVFTRTADGRPEQIIGMAEDVTERQRSRKELERSREQLRALSARLHEAREEERAAISRRVHDELGQALTALNWDLSWLTDRIAAIPARDTADIAGRMSDMSGLIQTMMQTVRKVAYELRPPVLDHFGLVAAIEWQANEFQSRFGIRCEVQTKGLTVTTGKNVSTAVFRIFQEILTNVARHAAATKVKIQFAEKNGLVTLAISDNGRGITEGEKTKSLGILGMRERALLFGGTVDIASAAGKGTTVTIAIPQRETGKTGAPKKETLRMLKGGARDPVS